MMEGPAPFVGRVIELLAGRQGRVSVRGARVSVALDLVPEAGVGDEVLVQAGVALSLVRDADGGATGV